MKARTSDRGVAAVEFALVVPILILLVLGIAVFGRAYNIQSGLAMKDLDAAEKHAEPGQIIYSPEFDCTLPPGVNPVPGGFGWLSPDSATSCQATSFFGTFFGSDPGKDLPCPASEIEKLRNQKVLIPLYDDYGGSGSGAWLDVMGYAAFTIKGYLFVGSGTPSWGVECPKTINVCISGYFEEFVEVSGAFNYSPTAPDYSAAVVNLTE